MPSYTHAGRILVIDDDKNLRSLFEEVLGAAGYAVRSASHGPDAWGALNEYEFDLVVTDLSAETAEGEALYLSIVRAHPYLKDRFLFMADRPAVSIRRKTSRIEGRCIIKPFRVKELLDLLDILMAGNLKTVARKKEKGERTEARVSPGVEWTVFLKGAGDNRVIMARVEDLSRNGLRVASSECLTETSRVEVILTLRDLNLHRYATVVWARGAASDFNAGLRLDNPLPVSSILNLKTLSAGLERAAV